MLRLKTTTAVIALMALTATTAYAQDDKSFSVNIKAQNLTKALREFSDKTHMQLIYSQKQLEGLKTSGASGQFDSLSALKKLLAGTNLTLYQVDDSTYAIRTESELKNGFQKISYGENYQDNLEVLEDDEAADDEVDIDEIMVTASRREQALQDVPASITSVNPVEFTTTGLTSLGDIIEYTPGFHIDRNNGQSGRGSITARGVGQQGFTPVVAVYVDDTPMTSNSSFGGGSRIFFDGLLGDLERIELIKGPQGTLYGATAIGGAVRYITKKPALEEMRGGGKVNLSDTKDGGFNQIYSGYLSVPIVEDKIGVTLSGFYEDNSGLVDRVNPATGLVIKENADSSESYGISGDILIQASERLDFRIKAMRQKVKYNGTSLVRIDNANKDERYGKLRGDDQFSIQDTRQTFVSGTLNYDFDWATFTATSSYVKYEIGAITDITANVSGIIDLILGNPPGTTTSVPFSSPTESEKYVQEVRLTSADSDSFEWILGLYYADESTIQDQLAISSPGDFLAFQASFPSEYTEYAAFGNLTYYITPEFDVTVGMRYADTKMDLKFITDGPFAGGPSNQTLPTADVNIQTYLFTARYRPNEDTSLYARIASGYRPASANLTVFNPFTRELLSQEILEQDNLWSYEVGAKGNLSDGLFTYDLALWYLDWSNFQAPVSFFGVGTAANAKDGITAKGFEGSFTLNPANGFTITSTVAYTNSTLNEDEVDLNGLKGQFIPTMPKWTATTRANYEFDISSDLIGNIGGGFRYVQGSPSAFNDGDVGDTFVNIPSDSYVLADVSVGIQMENVNLNLFVTNLFNKEAFANIQATLIPGSTLLNATGTPVMPRTIGAVLSFDF